MGIDVLRLDDACCYERGHDRVILCDLRESGGVAIKVKPTIAHMRYVGGGLHDQGCRHRRAHSVSLLPVVLIHHLVGVLDACGEEGENCPWLQLLRAEGARHIFGQGPHSEPTRFLPMRLSSHTVCHDEEGKWFRQSGGRGGKPPPPPDPDGIFSWAPPGSRPPPLPPPYIAQP